jgi:RNA polymerase subunit RPABC4/transcription elongation factor Spt4
MSSWVTVEVDTRDSYDISLQLAIADTRMQVAEMYGVSLRDCNGMCLRCGAPEDEPDETCPNCERTTPQRYVCPDCGSPHLLQDAYIAINDPSDVRLFDAVICDACGRSKVTPKEL